MAHHRCTAHTGLGGRTSVPGAMSLTQIQTNVTVVTSRPERPRVFRWLRKRQCPRHRKPTDMLQKSARSCSAKPVDVLMFLRSPPPTHWVARRKAAVVLAVRMGLISLSDACDRYRLCVDEFANWEVAFDNQGIAGLLAKRPIRRGTTIRAATVRPREVKPEPQWPQYR